MGSGERRGPTIYTIGHSNHPLERFLDLLAQHGVELIVDVRSQPYSRHAPQFGRSALERSATAAGVGYAYLGRELGGRPREDELYDAGGRVLYAKLAATPLFRRGLDAAATIAATARAALLCSEEDPTGCHRRLLVARALAGRGVVAVHIRGDGRLQMEEELKRGQEAPGLRQLALIETSAEVEWTSSRSVLPARRRRSSSRL